MEYSQQLNELKSLVLSKCGIRYITPADCRRISIEISKQVNKNVSETTIKRLFGFAVVKHKFSNFTLSTLADFVDMEQIDQLIITEAEKSALDYKSLKENADKITQFTLKTIKNRAGIPYQYTIKRKFAELDLETFYESDAIFSALISQPGYGKTILLSHLTESLFFGEEAKYKESTVLFFTAHTFFNKELSRRQIDELLQVHLQLSDKSNVLEHIHKTHEQNGGKFILIIDGFSDLAVQKEDLMGIFDNLINLICALEDFGNIKLVMSMRSTTWARFYDRIRHSSYLMSKWYPGKHFNSHELNNVPPLSDIEVESIVERMYKKKGIFISDSLKTHLRYPFQIQHYYQLKEENPEFQYYTNISFFELVSRFIKEKIYQSNYFTEKTLFLKKIIQLTDYGKASRAVEKDKLFLELSAFRNAYMELLADGILMEEKSTDEPNPREYVRFLHPYTFEYFLFNEILEKSNLQINNNFLNLIQLDYAGSQMSFQLLQWAARFLVITNNFAMLKNMLEIGLLSYDLNYLLLFIAEEIKYRSKSDPEMLQQLEIHEFHDYVISKLINFDFIDTCYVEAIYAFSDITLDKKHLITYHSILGIIDFCSLDKNAILKRIDILRTFHELDGQFNTAEALEILLHIIAGDPVNQTDLLHRIESLFIDQDPFKAKSGLLMDTQMAINYFYLLFIDMLNGTGDSGAKIINEILTLHPELLDGQSEFAHYLIILDGLNGVRATDHNTHHISNGELRLNAFLKRQNLKLSKYQEGLIYLFKARQAYRNQDYLDVLTHAKTSLSLFNLNAVAINPLMIYNLLINAYKQMGNLTQVEYYQVLKNELIAQTGITPFLLEEF